jgi:hypothetical protein
MIRIKFYSWYIYHDDETNIGKSISSAEYVEDVNIDSVIIVDGLTKVLPRFLPPQILQLIPRIELATSWVANLLGCRPQEPHYCLVSIRYVSNMRVRIRTKQIICVHRIFLGWRCQSPVSVHRRSQRKSYA